VKILLCYLLSCIPLFALAQLVEVPLGSSVGKRGHAAARQQDVVLNLPLWDDFSYTDSIGYPSADIWQSSQTVFLNNGIGINQPTKNVASFDGVDATGKPYNVNDMLAKGFADSLVSWPVRMDLVDPALRGTVYISFFYQVQGNAESPDLGDQLILSFKNSSLMWDDIRVLENDGSLDPKQFYQILIPITDAKYFHDKFQIRLRNFARISGPYDTWNVDYIYLNYGRNNTDTSYPDRAVAGPLKSLFNDYYAIPLKHFNQNPTANIKQPTVVLYNMRAGNLQPFDYSTEALITTKTGTQVTKAKIPLDVKQDPGAIMTGQQFLTLTLNTTPPASAFSPLADSIGIKFRYGMSTKDNVPIGPLSGDYDPAKYSPIDFRTNDSVRTNYVLSTYYAYDDGGAEYGAGLNAAGSYLAFKYQLKSNKVEKLTYVDIYFPQFGDFSNQSLQLQVRSDLSDKAETILLTQNIVVTRTTQNKFTRYVLQNDVPVSGVFYVGWKQINTANIPVGLDKNNDNGNQLFYNTNGIWVQNLNVKGSMMVRPGFGKPKDDTLPVGFEQELGVTPIYPNPARGVCYLPREAHAITVIDITGRVVGADVESLSDRKSLTFHSTASGLMIVRYFLNGKLRTEKVMVLAD
jgi:hypothetical protein